MAESRSYLAIVEGDDGIPLWRIPPTRDNIPINTVVVWLEPYDPLIVVMNNEDDGTSLIIHDGAIAYAVTACLFEV